MKVFEALVFLSLMIGNGYTMKSDTAAADALTGLEQFAQANPYEILTSTDEADEDGPLNVDAAAAVAPVPGSAGEPQLSLYDVLSSGGFRAFDELVHTLADESFDVNARSRHGGNTIVHVALMQPSLLNAYHIVTHTRGKIDTSLRNRDGLTVLDLAYERLAEYTISIQLGRDSTGDFYSVARVGSVMYENECKSYNIQRHMIPWGLTQREMYTIRYQGRTYCFDVVPLCSVRVVRGECGRRSARFEKSGEWNGWVDVV